MFKQINNCAIKNKKWLVPVAVCLILGFMFCLAIFSSKGAFGDPGDSGTVDEIAHIPSGYTYIKDQDFRLNPEHPPLAKALAGLPLVLKGIKGPESDWSWKGINQWEAGWFMIYENGNNPKEVFFWSRLPMMLLMIGLGLFLFKWAKEVFGSKVALVVLTLYAFYPDVLAHGRLVTTDIAAAFGYVIAIYFFDKALKKITWQSILIAALAFALAQLLKFSAFLLFGILLIMAIIKAIIDRKESGGFLSGFAKGFKAYFFVCALSVLFVWMAYIPFVWKTPVEVEHQLIEINLTQDPRTLPLRNLAHKFESNSVARGLGHYALGIMLVVARVEGGNKTFIMGHLSDKSISWYFPVAWLLKTQIPIILLVLTSIFWLIFAWPQSKKDKWLLTLILTPIIVYWAFTLKGSLNIGIRHLMPTVPFVLMLIGYTVSKLFGSKYKNISYVAIFILLAYMITSTLSNYPNFISYFNEATPKDKRYTRLIDSSLDWGQDLLRLKKYIDDNNIKNIKVDYFGGSVPSYYIPQASEWHSEYGPTTGWLAVSATFYQSSKLVGQEEGKWSYHWLDKMTPEVVIGGSILVFNITTDDFINNPPVSPYPITKFSPPNGKVVNPVFDMQKN